MTTEELAVQMCEMHIDHARFLSYIAAELTKSGESGMLLWLARQNGDVYATDAAEHFGLTPGRVANILKKLEERGFLVREKDPEDQRKVKLSLTPLGERIAGELSRKMLETNRRVIDFFGQEDTEELIGLLSKWITAAEAVCKERA